uniref:RING-type domain-containing protein n=1 Tax=Arundo donax TaxID=35708 RepID=A0A0A9CVR3_ARUDO
MAATPTTYSVRVSSETHKIQAWVASDEALARQLQEEENSRDAAADTREVAGNVSLEPSSPAVEYRPAQNAAQVTREDNVDPDNMSYEQLQALGEAVGSQSRGLSDDLICYLVPFKQKCNFSRKKNNEECVICKTTYKSRQKLIRLPCSHCYHADCITRWLKINKACPVCNEEVFG